MSRFFFIIEFFIVGTAHQRCIMVAHLQNNYINQAGGAMNILSRVS
jgi:hypothetical protein